MNHIEIEQTNFIKFFPELEMNQLKANQKDCTFHYNTTRDYNFRRSSEKFSYTKENHYLSLGQRLVKNTYNDGTLILENRGGKLGARFLKINCKQSRENKTNCFGYAPKYIEYQKNC